MAKHEIVVNRLTSNDLSNIKLGVVETYEQVKHYADFASDDVINKRALDEKTAGLDPVDKIEFVINVGDALPVNKSLPASMQSGVIIQQWRCVDSSFRELTSDALVKSLMVSNPVNLGNLIQRLDFYGYDDGTGHQLDPPLYYTITKA